MAFNEKTRQIWSHKASRARPSGGGTDAFELSKSNFLARQHYIMSGSTPNQQTATTGVVYADLIKRLTTDINVVGVVVDMRGRSYYGAVAPLMELEMLSQIQRYGDTGGTIIDVLAQWAANKTMRASIVIPHMFNMRDARGLIPLQNPDITVTQTIEWEATANIATGTNTSEGSLILEPSFEMFTVPAIEDPQQPYQDWPDVWNVQFWKDDRRAYAAGGPTDGYKMPRQGVLQQLVFVDQTGLPGDATPGIPLDTNLTSFDWIVNQNERILALTQSNGQITRFFDHLWQFYHSAVMGAPATNVGNGRPDGVFPLDLMASSALGNYGLARDYFNLMGVTDSVNNLTLTAAGVLLVARRTFQRLSEPLYPGRGQAPVATRQAGA
jgi:hypothetical protein